MSAQETDYLQYLFRTEVDSCARRAISRRWTLAIIAGRDELAEILFDHLYPGAAPERV